MKLGELEPESHRRGNLLEIANFLTNFQSHLVPDSANSEFVISPLDITNVLEYRKLAEDQEELEQECFLAEQMGRVNPQLLPMSLLLVDKVKDELDGVQAQVQDFTARSKKIHHLLRRFEVWTTKLVSQELFVIPALSIAEDPSKLKECCFSPLWNLPCSTHFSSILPEACGGDPPVTEISSAFHQHELSCCSLPLPPNQYTWKEFARISRMVGLMDDNQRKKATTSPCCVNEINRKRSNPSHSPQYQFEGADLVALWVRGQRNTQAMRHLWMLFEVTAEETAATQSFAIQGIGSRGAGKQLVVDTSDSAKQKENAKFEPRSFKATLLGNPTYTRHRIVEMSILVDQLVEWAVVNQVQYTYSHVKKFLLTAPIRKRKKRKQMGDLYKRPAKRIRRGSHERGVNLFDLEMACQSYVFRWFARRNRSAVSILFSSHLDFLHLDLGCMKSNRVVADLLNDVSVQQKIQEYLQQPDVSDKTAYLGDRTFARVDRRLFIEKRYVENITLLSQVQTLLQGLHEVAPEQHIDKALIESAKKDFRELYEFFFEQGKDTYEIALDLADAGTGSIETISQILKSAPCPWGEKCCACEKASDPDSLRTCVNCERIYHENCSQNNTTSRLREYLAAYDPLAEFCTLKQPNDKPVPDFGSQGSTEWISVCVDIERSIQPNGNPQPFGLQLRHTEECVSSFDALSSDTATIVDLVPIILSDRKSKRPKFPLAVDHQGCLIVEVKGGDFCGKSAGLQPGDIITEIELVEFADAKDAGKYQNPRVVNLKDIPCKQRMAYLKLKTTKLRLKVMRPNRDVVEISKSWYSSIKRLNKNLTGAIMDDEFQLWFCGDCLQEAPADEPEDEALAVYQEAGYCRAVIRRIGMESYALPFIDEDPETVNAASSQAGDSRFVSLRRLDSMMTYIIEKNSSDRAPTKSLSEAFLIPPWAGDISRRRRLAWAPPFLEDRPMELLCTAMRTLNDGSFIETDDHLRNKKKGVFRHFLFAFSSWCVGTTSTSSRCPTTVGPPKILRCSRAPWLLGSCAVCFGRPCIDDGSELMICDNPHCSGSLKNDTVQLEDIEDEEVRDISDACREYNQCASLVGSTFLVIPQDPLVTSVSQIVSIDHDNRPVEFVVASYLPPEFVAETSGGSQQFDLDKFEDGDGIFHLLPVVSVQQLKFLLERCRLRKPPKILDTECGISWTSLNVLNLEGVARYSLVEVQRKILESVNVRNAIDEMVASGCTGCISQVTSTTSPQKWTDDSRIRSFGESAYSCHMDPITVHSHLVESLLYTIGPPKAIRAMMVGEDVESSDRGSNDPDRLGVVSGSSDDCFVDKFGDSAIQVGMSYINLQRTSLTILSPKTTTVDACLVYYSDLYFENTRDCHTLEKIVTPEYLKIPERTELGNMSEEMLRTVLLSRQNAPSLEALDALSYKGIGWGFELLRWSGENLLRVGRICEGSPAHSAGLRTNDIIVAADGKRVGHIKNQAELTSTILGASSCRLRLKESSGVAAIAAVISAMIELKARLGAVVLLVYRPDETRTNQITHQIAAPQHSLQVDADNDRPEDRKLSHVSTSRGSSPVARVGYQADTQQVSTKTSEGSPNARQAPGINVPTEIRQAPLNQQHPPQGFHNTRQPTEASAPVSKPSEIPVNQYNPPQGQLSSQRPPAIPYSVQQPERLTRPNVSLDSLLGLARNSYDGRPPVTISHLYQPALNGTILTLCEVGIFLECITKGEPKLGLRLLCPRYEVFVIWKQVEAMANWSLQQILSIPRIPHVLYWEIMELDYKRATNPNFPETGGVMFREKGYEYRKPVDRLPIDRVIERTLERERGRNRHQHPQQQQHQQQQQQQHVTQRVPYGNINNAGPYMNGTARAPYPSNEVYRNANSAAGHSPPNQNYQTASRQSHSPSNWNGSDANVRHDDTNQSSSVSQANELASNDNHYNMPDPQLAAGDVIDLCGADNVRQNERMDENRVQGALCNTISTSPTDAQAHDQEPYTERIRGGGSALPQEPPEEHKGEDTCLADVPLAEWKDVSVYTMVQTANEGELGSDAMMVGFVKSPNAVNGSIPEIAQIGAYYLSNLGYFDKENVYDFESDTLFVVDTTSDSEAAKVVNRLRAKNLGPRTTVVANTSPSRSKWKENALRFVQRQADMSILGELPDGRQVVWISSDPEALYIKIQEHTMIGESNSALRMMISQTRYLSCISRNERSKSTTGLVLKVPRPHWHYCLWGCTVAKESADADETSHDALGFPSLQALNEHHSEHHTFCFETDETGLGCVGRFARIRDGGPICDLNAGLTAAICARLPSLYKVAKKESQAPRTTLTGEKFALSPSGERLSLPWTQQSVETVLKAMDDPSSGGLLHLWTRIGRLFELEESGLFRLSQSEFQEGRSQRTGKKQPEKVDRAIKSCEMTNSNNNQFRSRECYDCALCSLPWEKSLKWLKSRLNQDAGDAEQLYRGAGCALISEASFARDGEVETNSIPGLIGAAKSLLLRVAASLPDSLKMKDKSGVLDPIAKHKLWKNSNLDSWKSFVIGSSNTCMLAQAFTVLLASIQKPNLPRWWRAEGSGWSTAQMILASPNISALLLHIYVLDAAVAEMMADVCNKESKSNKRISGSMKKRFERFLKKADSLGFQSFTESHDEFCIFCDDGGELLCCELCQNVQHMNCCDPPIEKTDELNSWVCDSCINDINAQKDEMAAVGKGQEMRVEPS